jgi:hypothetical protein
MLPPARIGSQPIRDAMSSRDYETFLSLLDRACEALTKPDKS